MKTEKLSPNEAFDLIQRKAIMERKAGNAAHLALPKEILKHILRYATEVSPLEVFKKLKAILCYRWGNVSGLTYYGLGGSVESQEPLNTHWNVDAATAWSFLDKNREADISNFDLYTAANKNLDIVLDYLMRSHSPPEDCLLHPLQRAILHENEEHMLLTAFLKRRKELLGIKPVDDAARLSHDLFKKIIDIACQVKGGQLKISFRTTPLHLAAFKGDLVAYNLLISYGAKVPLDPHPLTLAVANDKLEFVRSLLDSLHEYPIFDKQVIAPKRKNTFLISHMLAHDGLLESAASKTQANPKMLAYLIVKGADLFSIPNPQPIIDDIIKHGLKEVAEAQIKRMGLTAMLTHPIIMKRMYEVVTLAGGYQKVCELTGTSLTDDRVLFLIAAGVCSQPGFLFDDYTWGIIEGLTTRIDPEHVIHIEETKAPILTAFTALRNPYWLLRPFQPDPISEMTSEQKATWFPQ